MEAKELTITEKVSEKIQLVKGEYTPSEASHIIMNLIDRKINFHKIRILQIWESNHNCNTDALDGRIKELEREREIAKEFIEISKERGQNIKIDGVLKMSIVE